MKMKKIIICSASVAILVTIMVLFSFGFSEKKLQENEKSITAPIKQITGILAIWNGGQVSEDEIVFSGKSDDMGFEGKAVYTYKNYRFYFDPEQGRVNSVIYYLDAPTIMEYENNDNSGISEDKLLLNADKTVELVFGNETYEACEKTVEYHQSTTVTYDYVVDGIHVPAAVFMFAYGKDLGSFILYDINIEEYNASAFISEGESLEKANTEAISYMKGKFADAEEFLEMDASSLSGEKTVMNDGTICWKWDLLYHWVDGRDMDAAFVIYVNAYTGDIIMNAHNY